MYLNNIAKKKDLFHKPFFFFSRAEVLCTYPVILSLHVCIYFEWFPLWLFLELDFLLWNIVLEVSCPFYNLITRERRNERQKERRRKFVNLAYLAEHRISILLSADLILTF